MNFFKTTTLLAISFMTLSFNANAGFVHTDWKVDGDQRSTLHEETGIEWLKLNHTGNMSINQVAGQLNSTYEGWRFPTHAEVSNLMTSFFTTMNVEGTITDGYDAEQAQQGFEWSDYMGDTYINSVADHARGITTENNIIKMSGAYTYNNGGTQLRVFNNYSNNYTPDSSTVYHSVFLVSDGGTTRSSQLDPSINNATVGDVSAPALLSLAGLGLFGFASRRRSY
jgi:MYXO-CTERM domain-containing protein